MRLKKTEIQKIGNTQAATSHFVFVRRTDSPRSGPDLYPPGRIFRCQFDHPMIGQDYVSPVADKKIAIDGNSSHAKIRYFFQEGNRIKNNTVANDCTAARSQHTGRD